MQSFLTSLALTLALGLAADAATAVGLGRLSSPAVLGQPLNATIGLRLEPHESIETRCVTAEVSFGDRTLPDALVRASVETAAASGERRIRVATTTAVDEPVVGIRVQLDCPSSLSRSYTLFADPPGGAVQTTSSQGGWEAEPASTPVSPILAAAETPARPVPRTRARGDVPSAAPTIDRSGSAQPTPPRTARDRAVAARVRTRAPTLRLDPVELDAANAPAAGAAPDGAAASPSPEIELAQRREEQARLQALEASLGEVRAEARANRQLIAQMQERVRTAESSRYANPLVYALAGLCAVLLVALGAMAWLRRRDRARGEWWAAQPAAAGAAPAPAPAPSDPEPVDDDVPSTYSGSSSPQPLSTPMPFFTAAAPVTPTPPVAPVRAPETELPEPRRPMSAEELIDLEQQAEFFVVLGQDEAAIDLLMGHVRSTGGVSPLPYLKLLEIYRRRGEREPYDRIRERFNRRFNAYAPEWDVDPEQGLSLDGYPEVMQRVQDAWKRPSQAMELLDGALFRRDAGPTFDVPAYRELLFLYSTARDLAERDTATEGVDLLLPLGDEGVSTLTSVPATSAAPQVPESPPSFSLDLDVSSGQSPLSLEALDVDDAVRRRSGR